MGKYIKRFIFKGTEIFGINRFARKFKAGATAFCYHGVENRIIDPEVQELHLSFFQFEKQIEYIRRNFEIISVEDLHDSLKNGYRIDPSQVLITFDDGYKNNFRIVRPYLKSLNLPFSIFICTNHIDKGLRFPTYYLRVALSHTEKRQISLPSINKKFDISTQDNRKIAKISIEKYLKTEPQALVYQIVDDLKRLIPEERWTELNEVFASDQPMSWEEIEQLNSQGVAIGSHCHDHFIVHAKQDKEEVDYQIKTSKELIERKLGECNYFAFPDGNEENIRADSLLSIRENGYFLGFTIVNGEIVNNSYPFLLPRIGISHHLDHFKFNINTGFRFNRPFRRWSAKFDSCFARID